MYLELYDKDQEGVRFSLNNTQYIYYYRENRLETSSVSVIEKYNDHLILYNGSEYFYSNNYGVDKRFLLKTSSKIITYMSAYEQYSLAMDSTGLVLRFNYSGSTDTLFAVTRPITIGKRRVLETKDYIIACTGTSQDSSYIDFYRKNNLEFVNSIRLNEGIRIRKNHILQEGSSVIFYDSRGKFTIFYPETKKTYRHNRVKFNDFDKFYQ
ncbi:MAG: hypothetical protein IPG79_04545 [Saprospiraceae bacterium]|nr:hypothetical protein [Saprospiraceae bacterium]